MNNSSRNRKIEFEQIIPTEVQLENLYKLLKKRTHTVSHKRLPSIKKHVAFVKSNPYRHWYLVKIDNNFEGSFYIQNDNSIGINIQTCDNYIMKCVLKFISLNFSPNPPKPSLISETFFINVPHSDKAMQTTLTNLGLQMAQVQFHFNYGANIENK